MVLIAAVSVQIVPSDRFKVENVGREVTWDIVLIHS